MRPHSQVGLTEQKSKTSRRAVRTAPPDILGAPRSEFYRSGLRVIRRCDPRKGWNTYVATDGSLMAPYLGPVSSAVGFSDLFLQCIGHAILDGAVDPTASAALVTSAATAVKVSSRSSLHQQLRPSLVGAKKGVIWPRGCLC
jgi:hypothetical protein